jgi:hypothetical protein
MNKHTQGPWVVMPKGFAKSGLWQAPTVYATDDELRYVAVCACADFANGANVTDNLANAHLISAAPDLLEALEAVVRVADRKTDEFDKARAAIAKAKGETP